MATPLPLSTQNFAYPVCETAIWVTFLIFLKGLMRAIKISGTRELIPKGVEMSQIFFSIIIIAKTLILPLGSADSSAKNKKMCNLTVINNYLDI